MSLDKAIKSGKERRKPYYGSKSIDRSCRNHGGCDWCLSNITIRSQKNQIKLDQELDDFNQSSRDAVDGKYSEV